MVIINSTIQGFWIGVLLGLIAAVALFTLSKTTLSGLFAVWLFAGSLMLCSFVGFLVGIVRQAFYGVKAEKTFSETMKFSSILEGNLTSISLYLLFILAFLVIFLNLFGLPLNRLFYSKK